MRPLSNTDHARLPPMQHRLPPLEKGVVDRTAIGGGICFAATPQIPRPRCARPAPFCKGGKRKADFAWGQRVDSRHLLQRPARQYSKATKHRLPLLQRPARQYPETTQHRLPPLKKGVVDRSAVGGGICFATTPQIPRPRYARPAPFCKGGKRKANFAWGQRVDSRHLLQRPARQYCKAPQHRLPPLEKGVADRTAIGGGICFAATPQIPRPRCARPAPFCKGGKRKADFAWGQRVDSRHLLQLPARQYSKAPQHRLPPLEKGVNDRTAIGGGICFAATPQIPRPRCARPAPFCKGGKRRVQRGKRRDDSQRTPLSKIHPFFIEPSP